MKLTSVVPQSAWQKPSATDMDKRGLGKKVHHQIRVAQEFFHAAEETAH